MRRVGLSEKSCNAVLSCSFCVLFCCVLSTWAEVDSSHFFWMNPLHPVNRLAPFARHQFPGPTEGGRSTSHRDILGGMDRDEGTKARRCQEIGWLHPVLRPTWNRATGMDGEREDDFDKHNPTVVNQGPMWTFVRVYISNHPCDDRNEL